MDFSSSFFYAIIKAMCAKTEGNEAAEGLQDREVKDAGRCKKTRERQVADAFETLEAACGDRCRSDSFRACCRLRDSGNQKEAKAL